ncbi:hypothetical protein OEZ85_010290 [Tetradesmus obliquus]|uniref:Uncharacterized protein n=1 Tax=Tetradesmus obliquus TaxID=3088 RepID=A0ABY8TRK5_TETOB|nr:hypothetical protein OEZ85_010290 [Tetradesmus obliquus]
MTGGTQAEGIHATGQPDTPIEVLTALLTKALQQQTLEQQRTYVQQALDIAAGLDDYLDKISSPPSQVVCELVAASVSHDWAGAHAAGKTQFLQKVECCSGTLEGRLLRFLVAATGWLLRFLVAATGEGWALNCFTVAALRVWGLSGSMMFGEGRLRFLVAATGAKRVLEIGMFTGTSSLAMAEALPEEGQLVALDIEPYMAEFAGPYFAASGLGGRIRPVIGPAQDSLAQLAAEGESFDLIFLDANKDGYAAYYDAIMQHSLLAHNGLLVVDNSLMKGRTYAPGGVADASADAVRAFNQQLLADGRVEVVALPFRDGVSLVRRRGNSLLQRFKLTGKAALVTGAGQGIGRAWAHALGEAGAAVAVVDLDLAKAQAVAGELLSKGVRALAVQADVASKKDCQRMVAAAVAGLGRLDIAVNNAGINRNSAAEDTPEGEWDMTFAVNAKGVFLSCQAEASHMLAQGYGKVINTASMASLLVPHPQKQAAYNASKAAVVKLTQSLACEWADRGVRVNCVSPGIVNTALIQESPDLQPLVTTWLQQIPAGRLAEVTDLQAAVVYLASEASDYMTGHNLVIEGGQSLW